MQFPTSQKHFIVSLEMPKGSQRHINVKASSSEIAGKRAMKRVRNAVKVHHVKEDI